MSRRDPTFLTAPPRIHRKRKWSGASAIPVGPLALVSAAYDHEAPSLTLTFNQAINASSMNAGLIGVHDGLYHHQVMAALLPIGETETSVTIELEPVSEIFGGEVKLNVDMGNGIYAVNGWVEWDGVTELELPFP